MGMIKLPHESIKFFHEHIDRIFESGNLAEGEWNEKVASLACEYTESSNALAVNSNGAGIFTILSVLKHYRNKKKVFLQENTMYGVRTMAITSGLQLCGYVDCSLDYLMPTYQQVVEFVNRMDSPEDSVFLLTHIGGWVNPDIEKIAAFCKEKGIALVEDCAHSLGSTLNEKHTGLFGDAGVYSFYATKAIPAGEGGLIVTKDEDLAKMASKFVIYDRFEMQLDIGVNLRMSEINALLTYSVMQETEKIIENKMAIAEKYNAACEKYGWRFLQPVDSIQRSNLYKYILIANTDSPVEEFAQIEKRTSPVYAYTLGMDKSEITSKHICLPIWYGLETEIVDEVVESLAR